MKQVLHCVACGFVSTQVKAYKVRNQKHVCTECIEAYGKDPDITRWMDEKGVGQK